MQISTPSKAALLTFSRKFSPLVCVKDSTQPDGTPCEPGREEVGEGVAAGPPVDPSILVQVPGARPGPPEHEGQRSSLFLESR